MNEKKLYFAIQLTNYLHYDEKINCYNSTI